MAKVDVFHDDKLIEPVDFEKYFYVTDDIYRDDKYLFWRPDHRDFWNSLDGNFKGSMAPRHLWISRNPHQYEIFNVKYVLPEWQMKILGKLCPKGFYKDVLMNWPKAEFYAFNYKFVLHFTDLDSYKDLPLPEPEVWEED